jgi:hypothetical protein
MLTRLAQACCRSLIVDTLPISQQQLGSAWGKLVYTLFFPRMKSNQVSSEPDASYRLPDRLCRWINRHGHHVWHAVRRHPVQANDRGSGAVLGRVCFGHLLLGD